MFKTILLATDGSPHAERSATIAADIAVTYGATLELMTVSSASLSIDDIASAPQSKRFSKKTKDELKKVRDMNDAISLSEDVISTAIPAPDSAIRELASEILNDAEKIARSKNIQGVVRISAMGDPALELIKQIEKSNVDLIVMGTRGLSNISGLVFGSVSHKVIHLAQCPCLTVK